MRQVRLSPWQQFQTYIHSFPKPIPEDSVGLRILVQLLVTVGIIATDLAADTQMSAWAVPISFVGAIWSYYRRRHNNMAVKFILAIFMLVALVFFFNNLRLNLNDTRLVLAELLVQIQVLHTFDLPRRKDLGYSITIGIILLGVAGTLSQTMAFAPVLLLFLTLALPVLILYYRASLGLAPMGRWRANKLPSYLSLKNLGIFWGITLSLGLVIFLVMPRFPGYQLQTFPVGTPTNIDESQVQNMEQGVVNPGYRAGDVNQSQGRGPGQVDSRSYYGFNSRVNQNLRGQLTPQEVMRVRSQAPGFWRVLAFDRYTGQGWEISRDRQILRIQRPGWTYRFFIAPPSTKAKTREVVQSYTAVSDLPNVIPALSHVREVFFPTLEIGVDPEGGLRSPLGLINGFTYSVISDVAYRNQTELEQAGSNYPELISRYYLQVPPENLGRIRQRTEEILAKSAKPLTNPYQKALYLAQYLKQNFRIDPQMPFLKDDEDLVEAFLFRYEGGLPDHFATALVVMLRAIGIPARPVAGFASGQFNPFTGYYTVFNTDAFMMAEVFFPQYGWFYFNPIPGMELVPPSVEEDRTFGLLGQFWNWVASWLPSPVSALFAYIWETIARAITFIFSGLWGLVFGSWLGLLMGLLGAVVAAFGAWLAAQYWLLWQEHLRLSHLPPAERVYQQLLKLQARQGWAKRPAQTPLEYADFCRVNLDDQTAAAVAEISRSYVAWRYGQRPVDIMQMRSHLQQLQKNQSPLKRLANQLQELFRRRG